MRHAKHNRFVNAIGKLASARTVFAHLANDGLILGNDNHIGDIGEYWARRYFEGLRTFKCYGHSKNCVFDIQLTDGTKVSVKTITAWSKTGYGTQVRPLDGKNWKLLVAVRLARDLFPEKIAIVPLHKLRREPEFTKNALRKQRKGKAPSTCPRFRWWDWLSKYEQKFRFSANDLIPVTAKET